jgi:hypothetical protein
LIFLCALTVIEGIAQEQREGTVAWFTLQELEALYNDHFLVPSDYAMLNAFVGSIDSAVEMLQFERFVTDGP